MTATQQPTITREPKYPGYDTLLDDDGWGEDFYLLIDGQIIGGTYHCPPGDRIQEGKQWASYGPAGYSLGHATREDAERVQLKAAGAADATVATEAGSAPEPEPEPLPVTWEQALAEAKEKGVGRCSDHAAMAAFCDANITLIVGAVSGQLIWEGAMRKGMTFRELGRLASQDPIACSELMWV
ncbi:hypothetical protein ABZT06_08430 [Streptomyces sp. NPDC005483]|uniref:hypothetical protein n=1 Tax=Streptomyces sp. NPDC005483 TaxID=3154882 RepID=UPI0033A86DB9